MRAVIVGSLSVVLLAGCGSDGSDIDEDAQFYRDGVARACVEAERGDLLACHDIVDSMIAPNSLPAAADPEELYAIGYSQACTYLYPGCDPATVERERKQALGAYEE
jgi:hypothetical protein